MSMSKRTRHNLAVFSSIQMSKKRIKYLMPSLTEHEKALKMNERFDVEAAQKEKRNGR
jgi:hypothetical protein